MTTQPIASNRPEMIVSAKDERRKVIDTLAINGWTASNRSPNIVTRDIKAIVDDEQIEFTYRLRFQERVVRIERKQVFETVPTLGGKSYKDTKWILVQSIPMKMFNIYKSKKDGLLFIPFLNKRYRIDSIA